MRALKFGGTSMVDAKSWRRVLDIIADSKKPVVIVSATDRTTRHLAKAAQTAATDLNAALKMGDDIMVRHKKIVRRFLAENSIQQQNKREGCCLKWIQQCTDYLSNHLKKINAEAAVSPQNNDAVLSTGEQLSARLFALCGQAMGLKTEWLEARNIMKTDRSFGSARPNMHKIEQQVDIIKEKSESDVIPVIGGFYGSDDSGQITTLGFEGSDYSASLIGNAIDAEAIEIWTDVSGVYSCDPQVIPQAKPIGHLSFNDAAQLANHGAKILHPKAIQPAASKKIPVLVKNIFHPKHNGTAISAAADKADFCKALTFIKNISVLKINTVNKNIRDHRLIEVFAILDKYATSTIALKTEKEHTVVVLKNAKRAKQLRHKLSEITAVREVANQGLIGLIGCAGSNEMDITAQVKKILPQKPKLSILNDKTCVLTLLVDDNKLNEAVKKLHHFLFE